MLNREIESKIKNHDSQLAQKTSNYIFNKNALVKIPSKRYSSGISIGDSIGAGSSAPNNFGFIQKFYDTTRVIQGEKGIETGVFYHRNDLNWTKEETGICKYLMSSNSNSQNINIFEFPWIIPNQKYKIALTYSKRTDGGTFTVVSNSKTLLTVNCNGTKKDGIRTEFVEVEAEQNATITITSGQKAYINSVDIIYSDGGVYNSINSFENWSVGGRKAKDYTLEELETMISYKPFDYLIWELFANDFSGQDLESYVNRAEYVLNRARQLGMDIIMPIACGSNITVQDDTKDRWSIWKNKQYELAIKYNACIIDYDILFGGYTNAKANGLIDDNIHPTDAGHTMMSNELCKVVYGRNCTYFEGKQIDEETTSLVSYGYIADNKRRRFTNNLYADKLQTIKTDNNGNKQFTDVMPIIDAWAGEVQLPKYAKEGTIANVGGVLYKNTSDWGEDRRTRVAKWEIMSAYMYLKRFSSLPIATAGLQNQIYLYQRDGKQDQLIMCVKLADGNYVWKSIQLGDVTN